MAGSRVLEVCLPRSVSGSCRALERAACTPKPRYGSEPKAAEHVLEGDGTLRAWSCSRAWGDALT